MVQKRNPLLFLTDILKAIEKTEAHIQSGKQEFSENETIQDATLFRLQTIGEAVNQLPEELCITLCCLSFCRSSSATIFMKYDRFYG